MQVVLVNPPSPPEFRVSRGLMGGFGMAVHPELLYPPIELAHVASVLEEQGHEVRLVDADAEQLDLAGTRDEILKCGPALVCLDSSSTSLDRDLALAREVREQSSAPVAILGSQVTYTPGEIFEANAVDLVVRGEPEYTLRDVAQRVASSQPLEGIEGTSWMGPDGKVVHEPDRGKIDSLDDLPLPSRHLLHNERYKFPGIPGAVTTLKSSRGCPFDCSFCGYTLAQGLRFRFRSPEHVLTELADLYFNHGLRHVVFRDPIFTTRKDRVRAICEGILEPGVQSSPRAMADHQVHVGLGAPAVRGAGPGDGRLEVFVEARVEPEVGCVRALAAP